MSSNSYGAGARALGDTIAALYNIPIQLAGAVGGGLALRPAGGCEIPAPCWEPRLAGSCRLDLPPGSAATVRVHVTNCGWSRQVVVLTATGKLAAIVKLEPTTLIVEPQDQATFKVTVHVPDKAQAGEVFSGALLVRGCLNHFARVIVRVADCASATCCDIEVKDCPDNIHHWYDHFYCPRPCRNISRTDVSRTELVTNG